jgi:hypothetical protein
LRIIAIEQRKPAERAVNGATVVVVRTVTPAISRKIASGRPRLVGRVASADLIGP